MNSTVELKEEITFDEFKAWMMGLVRGKGSKLPNIDDWRIIKTMMDKVVPDKETIIQHTPIYTHPPAPTWEQPNKYPTPGPWCGDKINTGSWTSYPEPFGGYGGYGGTAISPHTHDIATHGYGDHMGLGASAFSIGDGTTTACGTGAMTVTDTTLKVSQMPGIVK